MSAGWMGMRPVRARALAGSVVAVTALGLFAAPALAGARLPQLSGCANADTRVKQSQASTDAAATLCLVNAARHDEHLPPLTLSRDLSRAAQGHSEDEARSGEFSHTGSNGSSIGSRIAAAGYHATVYNEAIGAQVGSGAVPYVFVQMFLSDHGDECTTLLDPEYRQLGVGVAAGRLKRFGSTTFSLLTIDIALPRGEHPLSHDSKPSKTCPHTPRNDAYVNAHEG